MASDSASLNRAAETLTIPGGGRTTITRCFRRTRSALPAARRDVFAIALAGLVCAGLWAFKVWGVETITLTVGALLGTSWEVRGIDATIRARDGNRWDITLSAGALQADPPIHGVRSISLRCPDAVWDARGLRAEACRIDVEGDLPSLPSLLVDIDYSASVEEWRMRLHSAAAGDGRISGGLRITPGAWTADIQGDALDLRWCLTLASSLGVSMPEYDYGGRLDLQLSLTGTVTGATIANVRGKVRSLDFASTAGLQAGEGLVADYGLDLRTRPGTGAWVFGGHLAVRAGQLFHDPLLLDFDAHEGRLDLTGAWYTGTGRVTLEEWRFSQPAIFSAGGAGELDLGTEGNPLRRGEIAFDVSDVGTFISAYLNPILVSVGVRELAGGGRAAGSLRLEGGEPVEWALALDDVDLVGGQQGYELVGISGRVGWSRSASAEGLELAWRGGRLWAIELGPARVRAEAVGDRVRLTEPVSLPVFDGELRIERLEVDYGDRDNPRAEWEAVLTPVSMELVTGALGWPAMRGKVSGIVPAVTYADRLFRIEGAVLVRVFDGDVVATNLRLEDPFGVVPRLAGDLQIRSIDLDALTRTFSFGNIQGRLDGHVHGLRLENWEPVAFDAGVRTPAGDTSRHRISQKAVNNLASFGGGVSEALSRGLLRHFEEFSYSELGLSCRLDGGICYMGGIGDSGDGYIIVKGGGLPRIDVMGFSRRVDWNELLERLGRVTSGEAPRVE